MSLDATLVARLIAATDETLSPSNECGPMAFVASSTAAPWFQTWFVVHDSFGILLSVAKMVISVPVVTSAEIFVKLSVRFPGTNAAAPPFIGPVMAYVCTTGAPDEDLNAIKV